MGGGGGGRTDALKHLDKVLKLAFFHLKQKYNFYLFTYSIIINFYVRGTCCLANNEVLNTLMNTSSSQQIACDDSVFFPAPRG